MEKLIKQLVKGQERIFKELKIIKCDQNEMKGAIQNTQAVLLDFKEKTLCDLQGLAWNIKELRDDFVVASQRLNDHGYNIVKLNKKNFGIDHLIAEQ